MAASYKAPEPGANAIARAVELIAAAERPLIIAGGGAKRCDAVLKRFAERLDAPVVMTTNARGLMFSHPLGVPASPSLKSVAALMADADLVIAAGTEFGPTDYDMYSDGRFVLPPKLIRIDIDIEQLTRWPATIAIEADCHQALEALCAGLDGDSQIAARSDAGATRAEAARKAAWDEIGETLQGQVEAVQMIRDALPGSIIVGDSTQPVYAANLFYDHDRPGGWFNAATGFGALGYGPPAAIGASIAAPGVPVVCLSGDGGFQFTLPEVAVAVDAGTPVIFVVWNNRGYREIETSMRAVGVEPVGVSPLPPDFCKLAEAYGIASERLASIEELSGALLRAREQGKPYLVEIVVK